MHDTSPVAVLEALRVRDLIELLDVICRRHHVTRDEVCGRVRTRMVARARHELWWQLRHHQALAFSYEEIGRLFGRNHTTVIHGVRAFQKARSAGEVTRQAFLGWALPPGGTSSRAPMSTASSSAKR